MESKASQKHMLKRVFWDTTWANKNLGSISQAGMVNNLNDGMVWGLFPILLAGLHFDLKQIGIIVSVYPAVWGMGQLFTGKLADILPKRGLLFWGMLLQGIVLLFMAFTAGFNQFIILSALLGIGTAMVYPTFLAGIAAHTNPVQRAESIGVFRLWRDLGYALGAVLTGIIADLMGIKYSVVIIALITLISALIIRFRMDPG
jgi:MFS family permease